ncbi:hypothetical protein M231_01357 [Tremella mesenterica]|uniref:Uncharacterized protein n=1 Tax=Tremella mesenterica TaxID=5217 RepID=A0A4Q1BTP4_TREME|nr:hypothetical protein M231_01357 [Tremella mesenterica]
MDIFSEREEKETKRRNYASYWEDLQTAAAKIQDADFVSLGLDPATHTVGSLPTTGLCDSLVRSKARVTTAMGVAAPYSTATSTSGHGATSTIALTPTEASQLPLTQLRSYITQMSGTLDTTIVKLMVLQLYRIDTSKLLTQQEQHAQQSEHEILQSSLSDGMISTRHNSEASLTLLQRLNTQEVTFLAAEGEVYRHETPEQAELAARKALEMLLKIASKHSVTG